MKATGRAEAVGRRAPARGAVRWSAAGFFLALAASLVLLLAPLSTQVEATARPTPGSSAHRNASGSPAPTEEQVSKVTHPSLLETEGWGVVVPLSVPVVLAELGLIAALLGARGALTGIAVLLGAYVWVSALSVGVYYVPAETALIVAGVKGRHA